MDEETIKEIRKLINPNPITMIIMVIIVSALLIFNNYIIK